MLVKPNGTELNFHLEKLKIMTTTLLNIYIYRYTDVQIAQREGRKMTEMTGQ